LLAIARRRLPTADIREVIWRHSRSGTRASMPSPQ
jgi:hypothetical protein